MLRLTTLLLLFSLSIGCYTGCIAQTIHEIDSLMLSRRSIRKYINKQINRETLQEILTLGINAPNGKNQQSYEIRVVDNPKILSDISNSVISDNPNLKGKNNQTIFLNAPCVIFIANDTKYDASEIDCGLLGENIILSAWARGLGTCCMAHPIRLMKASKSCQRYIKQLQISNKFNLLYCIAIGYPAETPEARKRTTSKIKFIEECNH